MILSNVYLHTRSLMPLIDFFISLMSRIDRSCADHMTYSYLSCYNKISGEILLCIQALFYDHKQ